MKNVIITGSTGMVGKGVLLECLDSPKIERVMVINRQSLNMHHPKLEEILLADFSQIETVKKQLVGYDACFYCMGVSVLGMSEGVYHKITYDTTKAFVDVLFAVNPDMVFNYVSGVGTDSSEKGKVMWARIKGKTENMLLDKGFRDAYCIRLGGILPEKGIKSKTKLYNIIYIILRPFYPLMKRSQNMTTTSKLGKAMINTLLFPLDNKFLNNRQINILAEK